MSDADRNHPRGHELVQHARSFRDANGNTQTEDGRPPGLRPAQFHDSMPNGLQPIQVGFMDAHSIIDNRGHIPINQNMNNIQRSMQHRDYKKVADVNQYQNDAMHVMSQMPPLVPMHQAQQANRRLPPLQYDLMGNSFQNEKEILPQMSNEGARNLINGATFSNLETSQALKNLQMKVTELDRGINFHLASLQQQVHQHAPPSNQVEQQLFTAQQNGVIPNSKRTFRNVHSISNDQIPDSLPNIGHSQLMTYAHESTNSFISQSPANLNSVEHPIYDAMEPLMGLQYQSSSNCGQMQNEIAQIPEIHALCSESTKGKRKSRKKNKNETHAGEDDDDNNVGIHREKISDRNRKPSNEEDCEESSLNVEVAIESMKPAGSERTKRKYIRRKKPTLDAESNDVVPESIPKEKRKYAKRKKPPLDAESNDVVPGYIPKEKRKYTKRKKPALDTESNNVAILELSTKEKRKHNRRKKLALGVEPNDDIPKSISKQNEQGKFEQNSSPERKQNEIQPIRRRSRRNSSENEFSESKGGENNVCHFNSIDEKSRKYLQKSHSMMRKLITSVAEDYSNSPLGELWVQDIDNNKTFVSSGKQTSSNNYKLSLFGRRPIWDEGHFTDGQCHTDSIHVDQEGDQNADEFVPPHLRAYCNCGRDHFEEDLSQEVQARRSGRSGNSVKMSRVSVLLTILRTKKVLHKFLILSYF